MLHKGSCEVCFVWILRYIGMHGSDRVNLEARSMVYSPIPEYAPLPLRVQMTNCKQKWYTDWSSQTTFLKKIKTNHRLLVGPGMAQTKRITPP